MAIQKELLSLLVCPETQQGLTEAGSDLVNRINQAIEAGKLRNRAGRPVDEKIEEGLLREDGSVLYPVRDSIPVMLIDEAIDLESLA